MKLPAEDIPVKAVYICQRKRPEFPLVVPDAQKAAADIAEQIFRTGLVERFQQGKYQVCERGVEYHFGNIAEKRYLIFCECALSRRAVFSRSGAQHCNFAIAVALLADEPFYLSGNEVHLAVYIVGAYHSHAGHISFRVGSVAPDMLRSPYYARCHAACVFAYRFGYPVLTGKRVYIRRNRAENIALVVFVAHESKARIIRALRYCFQQHQLTAGK